MASRPTTRHLWLTGAPGCGKTTLIKKLVQETGLNSAEIRGFFTEEVRQGGQRVGFDIVTLDGQRGPLSRADGGGPGKPMVGKYAVDVRSLETLALPQLDPDAPGVRLWVVDELGYMELKSKRFFPALADLLTRAPLVLGTLPLPRTGRLVAEVEAVRERADVEVVHVTRGNRDQLAGELAQRFRQRLGTGSGRRAEG